MSKMDNKRAISGRLARVFCMRLDRTSKVFFIKQLPQQHHPPGAIVFPDPELIEITA